MKRLLYLKSLKSRMAGQIDFGFILILFLLLGFAAFSLVGCPAQP
jgi:hypothetical protein